MLIQKYPSTVHLEGSRHQVGDSPDDIPLKTLIGQTVAAEEKLDGANCAVSFDEAGMLHLQSRGHFLTGGAREGQFSLFKSWARTHSARFQEVLGDRFVMYGEWLYALHSIFYDALPHYFFEFDVFDRHTSTFLDTPARRALLSGLPVIPAPVLTRHTWRRKDRLQTWLAPSLFRSDQIEKSLEISTREAGVDSEWLRPRIDMSPLAEGLYVKTESEGRVTGRFKHVRGDFVQTLIDSEDHWQSRPIIPNRLAPGVDLFAATTGYPGAYDA